MYRQGDSITRGTFEYLTEPKKRKQRTNKQKIAAAILKLAAEKWRLRNVPINGVRVSSKGIKKVVTGRERKLHFRWKRFRLTLCLGGTVIAAWPGADDGWALALLKTKMMMGEHIEPLSGDSRKIRSMALRLREALVKAEEGPRRKSAQRQRARIDQLFKLGVYKPIVNTERAAMWTCDCDARNRYALSVESCLYCHKKAPRRRI